MTPTSTISYGFKSDAGRRRKTNEDSCAVLNRSQLNDRLDGLLIVADGLGGRRAGEVASSLLVETISLAVLETTVGRSSPLSQPEIEELLKEGIVRANGKILTQGSYTQREEMQGMATTCVSAIVENGKATIANVGDSRIYLLRAEEITQLTADHSEVFREYVEGNLTEAEARNHRFRNQITRAVGLEANVDPDISTIALKEGDTLLLCSDGLTTEVPDDVIAGVLSSAHSAKEACDRLVSIALKHGGRDNVTVVVMRFGDFIPSAPFLEEQLLIDEPDTDPEQAWREEARNEVDAPWSHNLSSSDNPDDALPPARSYARSASSAGGVLLAIIAVLALAVLVESAMLIGMHAQLAAATAHVPPPQPNAAPPSTLVAYNAPALVMNAPILPDILQLSSKGNPVVATMDGVIQTYLPDKQQLIPFKGVITAIAPAGDTHTTHPKSHGDVCFDSAGNIYLINADTKCVETYTADGTRTNQDLGKGKLKAPTKLIVDSAGSIYVIDENRLKVIKVTQTLKSAHPADEGA